MRTPWVFLSAVIVAILSRNAAAAIKPGMQSPWLRASHVVQGAAVEGEPLVIPGVTTVVWFWATWCAPCVAHIPQYNATVERASSPAVRFVAVSPESVSVVRKFLKQRPIGGWVVADPEERLVQALDVDRYPTIFVIGPTGRVLAVPPGLVPAEVILAAARGATITVDVKPKGTEGGGADAGLLLSGSLRIASMAEVCPNGSMSRVGNTSFEAHALSLSGLLEQAYEVRPDQIEWRIVEPAEPFDATIEFTDENEGRWRQVLAEMVQAAFGIRVHRETRTVESYQLVGNADFLERSKPQEESKITRSDGELRATAVELDGLSLVLGVIVEAPVANEIPSKERYDIALKWDPGKRESIFSALEGLGLRLRRGQTTEEHIIVEGPVAGS